MLKRCILIFVVFLFVNSIFVFGAGGYHSASEILAGTFGSQNKYEAGNDSTSLKSTLYDVSSKISVSGVNAQSGGIGVYGKSTSSGYGMVGESTSGMGVVGTSGSSYGIYASSTTGYSGFFDHGNLIVAAGNVGINTTSPSQKLDVNGYVKGTGVCIGADCRTAWPVGGIVSESDPQVGAVSTSYVPKWDGSALVTGTIYDNGNIGIGTSSPGAKLSVVDSAGGSTPAFKVEKGTAWIGTFTELGSGHYNPITQSGDKGIIFNSNALMIAPWTSQYRGMRINSAGEVGIGTATPRGRVDINSLYEDINYRKPGLYVYSFTAPNPYVGDPITNYNSFSAVVVNPYGGTGAHGGLYVEGGSQNSWPAMRVRNPDGAFITDLGVSDTDITALHGEWGIKVEGSPSSTSYKGSAAGYFSNGGSGSLDYAVQAVGKVYVSGALGTMGKSPTSGYPSGWGGGIHSWDIYAEGTVGAGPENGPAKAYMNRDGQVVGITKNFVIDHPSKEGYQLVHSTLEGPESAVFYRGESQLVGGKVTVLLPDYFEDLTRVEGRSVVLTPKLEAGKMISSMAASEVRDGRFEVASDGNPSQKFYWLVIAVRKDIPPLVVEQKE